MSRYITIDTPPTALDSNGLPYQRLDAPLAAFGGNDANALGQFSNTLDRNVASYRDQLRQQQQLLAHESAANDALTGFRLGAVQAGRQYTGLRMKDAVDGHDGYLQAITQNRDSAIQDLPGPARTLLKPHLDRAFNVARQLGQDHQMAQDHAWSDQSSLDSLDADAQEAVLHRNNPDQVQALADRAVGEWAKIGERRGWDDNTVRQLANQSNGRLYGAVIDQHLRDGNLEGAQTVLRKSQPHLDPDTLERLRQKVAAGGANGDAITPDGTLAGGAGQIDPRLVQLADTNGTNPAADTTMSDAPSGIIGGQQQAQLPDGGQIEGDVAQTNTKKKSPPVKPPSILPRPTGPTELSSAANNDGASTGTSVTKNRKSVVAPGLEARAQTGAKVPTYEGDSETGRTSYLLTNPIPQPMPGQVAQKKVDPILDSYTDEDIKMRDKLTKDMADGKIGNWDWNIGNVTYDGTKWDGMGPKRGAFVTALTPEYGVRINYKNFLAKIPLIAKAKPSDDIFTTKGAIVTGDVNTLKIKNLGRYWLTLFPGSSDKEADWITNVSLWSGIDADKILNPDDINQMAALMRGINHAEKGRQTVPQSAYLDGVKMALGFMPPPQKTEEQQRREYIQTLLQARGAGPASDDATKNPTRNIRPLLEKLANDRLASPNFFERGFGSQ